MRTTTLSLARTSLYRSRVGGNRRVPHVRLSVRGLKMVGAARRSLSLYRLADLVLTQTLKPWPFWQWSGRTKVVP
jgi:hypothetical protein